MSVSSPAFRVAPPAEAAPSEEKADRLPLIIALPVVSGISLGLWYGIYAALRALLG
ncbi:hypothetical protein [Muricoccus radiodurans]|uniref:hypothetical protein n=1 Tax=Muricoccus radiodurans TaxID=2231721 RepID=UPI003CF053C3